MATDVVNGARERRRHFTPVAFTSKPRTWNLNLKCQARLNQATTNQTKIMLISKTIVTSLHPSGPPHVESVLFAFICFF